MLPAQLIAPQGSMVKSMPAAQLLIPAKHEAASTCYEVLWGVSIEYNQRL